MADIELIVKISEESYNNLKKGCTQRVSDSEMIEVLKNGTPLPKGHGRIADMDAAIKCIREAKGEDASWAIALIEWACSKRTIIEADKAESEDKE